MNERFCGAAVCGNGMVIELALSFRRIGVPIDRNGVSKAFAGDSWLPLGFLAEGRTGDCNNRFEKTGCAGIPRVEACESDDWRGRIGDARTGDSPSNGLRRGPNRIGLPSVLEGDAIELSNAGKASGCIMLADASVFLTVFVGDRIGGAIFGSGPSREDGLLDSVVDSTACDVPVALAASTAFFGLIGLPRTEDFSSFVASFLATTGASTTGILRALPRAETVSLTVVVVAFVGLAVVLLVDDGAATGVLRGRPLVDVVEAENSGSTVSCTRSSANCTCLRARVVFVLGFSSSSLVAGFTGFDFAAVDAVVEVALDAFFTGFGSSFSLSSPTGSTTFFALVAAGFVAFVVLVVVDDVALALVARAGFGASGSVVFCARWARVRTIFAIVSLFFRNCSLLLLERRMMRDVMCWSNTRCAKTALALSGQPC
jgi:hypothetical protein